MRQIQRHAAQIRPFNPFPDPGRPPARPSGPSILAAAAEGAPGVARTRPRAPRDLKSKRKKLLSGLKIVPKRPSSATAALPVMQGRRLRMVHSHTVNHGTTWAFEVATLASASLHMFKTA